MIYSIALKLAACSAWKKGGIGADRMTWMGSRSQCQHQKEGFGTFNEDERGVREILKDE